MTSYYDEAFGQVSDALSSFSQYWNEHNNGIDRRYWFTQLYRAIVFSKLSLDDNDPKYTIINSKIYNILSGEFNISWQGEVFAFDLKGENDNTEQNNDGSFDINVHTYGQISIQKMLLPREDGETMEYVEIDQDADLDQEEEDYTEETDTTPAVNHMDSSEHQDTPKTTSANDVKTPDTTDSFDNTETKITSEPPESDNSDSDSTEATETGADIDTTTVTEETPEKKSICDVRIWLGSDMKNGEKFYWEFGNKSLNNRHLLMKS